MNRAMVIKEFQAMIDMVAKGVNPLAILTKLKGYSLNRVELMIIDSAIKGMPLEHLDQTLLLPEKGYDHLLQNLTFKLAEVYQKETALVA